MKTFFAGQIVNKTRVIDFETKDKNFSDCECSVNWELVTSYNPFKIDIKVISISLVIYNKNNDTTYLTFPPRNIKVENIKEIPTGKEIKPKLIDYVDGEETITVYF